MDLSNNFVNNCELLLAAMAVAVLEMVSYFFHLGLFLRTAELEGVSRH